jgi:serine/threonine protein kinase
LRICQKETIGLFIRVEPQHRKRILKPSLQGSKRCYRYAILDIDETVAVKVIDMKMIKGEVHKNLLASEIDVLKNLKNSENIIEVYDIYNTKNNTYIITELCDGGDLSKLISNKKCIQES